MTAQKYRYELRTLNRPIEVAALEAGPFTPDEAALFAQAESAKRAIDTGRAWTCDYAPIVEGAEAGTTTPHRPFLVGSLLLPDFLTGMLIVFLVILLWALFLRTP